MKGSISLEQMKEACGRRERMLAADDTTGLRMLAQENVRELCRESREKGPNPVLALTIVDAQTLTNHAIAGNTKLLVGVRKASSNITHPDVVSVPTGRIPREYGVHVLATQDMGLTDTAADTHDMRDYVAVLVRHVLGKKISSDFQYPDNSSFKFGVMGHQVGEVEYFNLEDSEIIDMMNVLVIMDAGVEHVPSESSEYSDLRWVTVRDFLGMMEGKDVTRVGIDARRALGGVCVTGLCVSTTEKVLHAKILRSLWS